jgi:hypothetical protein
MNILKAENTATYYCARNTVRSLQWKPRNKLPCSDSQYQQEAFSTHRAQSQHQAWCRYELRDDLLCVFGWLPIYQFSQRNLLDLLPVKIYEISEYKKLCFILIF